jgi:arylsulfatase A-like enzyme
VDLYPTVLSAVGRPIPELPAGRPLHGVDLRPAMEDPHAPTRDVAIAGQFGKSVTITDGRWVLHQSPVPANRPLYWYGYCLAKFVRVPLGPYARGRRPVLDYPPWPEGTWLSDRQEDPGELVNLAEQRPDKLRDMQRILKQILLRLKAPCEQLDRLGLRDA